MQCLKSTIISAMAFAMITSAAYVPVGHTPNLKARQCKAEFQHCHSLGDCCDSATVCFGVSDWYLMGVAKRSDS